MVKYFQSFPTIKYENEIVKDITLRVKILDDIQFSPYTFLPYTIEEGMTPEQLADFYYGSPSFVWLVLLSNEIIDPFTEWPKSDRNLQLTIRKKYASEAAADSFTDVISWARQKILHYRNKTSKSVIISKDSYDLGVTNSTIIASEWEVVFLHDFLEEENENKRQIRLLNVAFAQQAETNLRRLLNVG